MKIYIYIISLLLALGACSESEPVVEPGTEKEELVINAGVHTTVEDQKTRASSPFAKEFYMYQTQNSTTVRNTASLKENSTNDFNIKDSSDDIIYWDDIGGVSASVNLIGLYPKINAPVASGLSSFSWTVASNQSSATDYENSDLLISNKLTGYTLEKQKGTVVENKSLTFQHVLSNVKLKLEGGTGFTDDFEPTAITLLGMNTSLTVAIDNDGVVTTSGLGTPTNITPKQDGSSYVYEAIVLPGQSFNAGDEFVSFDIELNGNKNTYKAKLSKALTFASGSEHIFTVTVNKVDLEVVTVTLEEWAPGGEEEETILIDFEGYSGSAPKGEALKDDAELYIELDKQKVKYDYTHSGTKWAANPTPLYLDDVNIADDLYGDAVLIYNPENTPSYYAEQIYTGKSQEMDKRYKQLIFEQMKHPFSKVNITVRTEKGKGYSVDLTKLINIKFNAGIKQFKSIDLGVTSETFRTITYLSEDVPLTISTIEETTSGTPIYEYYALPDPLYIEPVNFATAVELFRIFYEDTSLGLENEYPLKAAANFEANKEYNIIVTLKKTEIAELTVSITPWEPGGDIKGNAGIDK